MNITDYLLLAGSKMISGWVNEKIYTPPKTASKRPWNPINRQVVQHVHRPWLVICIRNTNENLVLRLKFVDRVGSYVCSCIVLQSRACIVHKL